MSSSEKETANTLESSKGRNEKSVLELIEKLCPDGVEYKKIEEVTQYEQPGKYLVSSTKYKDEYPIPVLTAGKSFILGYTKEKDGVYKARKEKPVIIFDDFTTSFHWVDFEFKVKSSAIKLITAKNKNLLKYIYYAMQCIKFEPDMAKHIRHWINVFSQFEIPIPPLKVQEKIIEILDSFSESTDKLQENLEKELDLRKKQYEYYRDDLLSFPEKNIEYKKLSEICESIRDGLHNLPKDCSEKYDIPILSAQNIKNGRIIEESKRRVKEEVYQKENNRIKLEVGDVLLTIVATIGRTAVITKHSKFLLQRSVSVLKPKSYINSRYLRYYLDTYKIQNFLQLNANGGAQKGIYLNKVRDILIAVPPIEKQKQIVEILEPLEKLTQSLTEGIPAEIEGRKKQYEYYRDLILNFKRKED